MFRLVGILVIGCAMAASGCVGSARHDLLNRTQIIAAPEDIAAKHDIFVATTRKPATADPRQVFGRERSLTTNYASIEMTVPKIHKIGKIERSKGLGETDPARHFAPVRLTDYDGAGAFARALDADIAARGDRVLVFVHGYNNAFDDGMYRVTQLAHDTGYSGTPVLFSWASGAETRDYIYDRDSALAARDNLTAALRLIARTRAKRIDIIAHSMGTSLTMESLRDLAIAGDRTLSGKLGFVVLASPDIDVDVFKKMMLVYGKPERGRPIVVLQSADDKALRVSSAISGDRPRLGQYGDAKDLLTYGVVSVDLTRTKSGEPLGHSRYADNPILVQLLGDRLRESAGLEPDVAASNRRIAELGKGLGSAVGSVAEIVITTPLQIFTLGAGR